ncbi:MAG TPA: DUF6544 family protein [Phenylobacterium sp.]
MISTPPRPRLNAIPPEVAALAYRCGAEPNTTGASQVVLAQTGSMRPEPDRRWVSFRARQSLAVDRSGFHWRAVTGPFGSIVVTDALEDAGPRLSVVALGFIPLAKAAVSDALTKGELQRYLAELPLAPDAILRNSQLVWTVLDADTFRVAASHRGVHAHVDLQLGEDGFVASAMAPDRPRLEGAVTVERPWTGCFSDYRLIGGRRLPFVAEASWTLGGETSAYWRAVMTSWELRGGA